MYIDSTDTFNNIYTTFYRKSYLFVKSYVHDELVAEDIVSESLIKLWERIKTQPIEHVSSFLFTILKNSALDHLKHEIIVRKAYQSLHEIHNRELEIRTSVLQSCDHNEIFSTEIQQIIQKTLDTLPEKSRHIFMMSRFEHKSNKEIAEIFNITVKGVDYHISLTTKALRINLKDYLPCLVYLLLQ